MTAEVRKDWLPAAVTLRLRKFAFSLFMKGVAANHGPARQGSAPHGREIER